MNLRECDITLLNTPLSSYQATYANCANSFPHLGPFPISRRLGPGAQTPQCAEHLIPHWRTNKSPPVEGAIIIQFPAYKEPRVSYVTKIIIHRNTKIQSNLLLSVVINLGNAKKNIIGHLWNSGKFLLFVGALLSQTRWPNRRIYLSSPPTKRKNRPQCRVQTVQYGEGTL